MYRQRLESVKYQNHLKIKKLRDLSCKLNIEFLYQSADFQ